MKTDVKIFLNPPEAADELAADLFTIIEQTISCDKLFNIAISGGSTPIPLFLKIANKYSEEDWDNIHIYWVDERAVPIYSTDSNYGLAKKYFIHKINIAEKNIHRIKGEDDAEKEAVRYSEEIKNNVFEKNGLPSFNYILLGVGSDGHIASIFPDQMSLLSSENICEVSYHPITKKKRITLTGKIINNADKIAFFVTGTDKAKIISEIFKHEQELPATHIKPPAGKVVWYLDNMSASLLDEV